MEIGPCAGRGAGGDSYISRFIHGDGGRLRLRGHKDRCVTFLRGDAPTTRSSVMLGPCPAAAAAAAAAAAGEWVVDKYGWDFVPERDLLSEGVRRLPPLPRPRSRSSPSQNEQEHHNILHRFILSNFILSSII